MTDPVLRQTILWLPTVALAVIAAALTAVPGNTVTFLLETAQPILSWIRP